MRWNKLVFAAVLLAAVSAQATSAKSDISRAQRQMNTLSYYSGSVDGVLGYKTRLALMSYQHANAIAETGQYDAQTEALLSEHYRLHTTGGHIWQQLGAAPTRAEAEYISTPEAPELLAVEGKRLLPARNGRLELLTSRSAGGLSQALVLNGNIMLQADRQPVPILVLPITREGEVDTVTVAAQDGIAGCVVHYRMSVMPNGQATPVERRSGCIE